MSETMELLLAFPLGLVIVLLCIKLSDPEHNSSYNSLFLAFGMCFLIGLGFIELLKGFLK